MNNIKYVSLGCNFSINYHLNKLYLSNETYPFDWTMISLNNLIHVLNRDFKWFDTIKSNITNENRIVYDGKNREINISNIVLENEYGVQWNNELVKYHNLGGFKLVLNQRIKRFFNLKNNFVIFIRIEIGPLTDNYFEKIKILDNTLNSYFDNDRTKWKLKLILPFKYIDIQKEFQNIEFYWYDKFIDWKMENLNWKQILKY